MDSYELYNQHRYNRKRQQYRFMLGIQQLINYPFLNLIWVLYAVGIVFLVIGEKKFVENVEVYPVIATIFSACMTVMIIVFSVMCAIGIIQLVGCCFAIKDEADIEIILDYRRDVKNKPPILIYKKKDRKTKVIKREFYTTIPMERWQERKDAICDRMDIHLIGDISYGGRKKNKGNHIFFASAKGRNPKERGVLYDDTF